MTPFVPSVVTDATIKGVERPLSDPVLSLGLCCATEICCSPVPKIAVVAGRHKCCRVQVDMSKVKRSFPSLLLWPLERLWRGAPCSGSRVKPFGIFKGEGSSKEKHCTNNKRSPVLEVQLFDHLSIINIFFLFTGFFCIESSEITVCIKFAINSKEL